MIKVVEFSDITKLLFNENANKIHPDLFDGIWYWKKTSDDEVELVDASCTARLGLNSISNQASVSEKSLNSAFSSVKSDLLHNRSETNAFLVKYLNFVSEDGSVTRVKLRVTILQPSNKEIEVYGLLSVQTDPLDIPNFEERQSRLKLATSIAGIGVWEYNHYDRKIQWDDIMYKLYEVNDEETNIDLKKWVEKVHPDDRQLATNYYNKLLQVGTHEPFEFRILLKDGNVKYLRSKANFERNSNGEIQWLVGTHVDITNEKKAEIELLKSLEQNKTFVEQAPTAIAMFDNEMRYIAASEKWKSDYGIEKINLIGKSHYEVFPEIGDEWKKIHQECLAGAVHKMDEDNFVREDGSVQWLKWEDKPWYKANGEIGGIIMFTDEISIKKRMEEQLDISERSFKGSFEYAAVGMAILNSNGKWQKVNHKVCEIVGYTEEELLNLSFQDITHPDDVELDLNYLNELLEGKRDYYQMKKRYIHKEGHIVYIILAVSLVRNQEGKVLYLIAQIIDITELEKTQRELTETLLINQSILDSSSQVSIISSDINGIIKTFNKGAENLLGYSARDVINKTTPAIIHLESEVIERGETLSKEYQKEVRGFDVFVEKARHGETETREWTYIKKSGEKFPVQLSVSAISNGKEIVGFLGIAVNITKLKQVETEKQSLLDVAQEQNTRLRNFAHIVSHNLRSHSGNIDFLINIIKEDFEEMAQSEIFKLLNKASNGLKETIMHLNEVAQINTTIIKEKEKLNVHQFVTNSINSIFGIAKEAKVSIYNEVDNQHFIYGIPAYFDSIVLNFITNAIKYKSIDRESYLKISSKMHDGKTIIIFEDNGLGIDLKRYGEKLFGLYKTFHSQNDSKGVGLFITKSQVEALGGKIEVESEVNVGSKFIVTIPNEKN